MVVVKCCHLLIESSICYCWKRVVTVFPTLPVYQNLFTKFCCFPWYYTIKHHQTNDNENKYFAAGHWFRVKTKEHPALSHSRKHTTTTGNDSIHMNYLTATLKKKTFNPRHDDNLRINSIVEQVKENFPMIDWISSLWKI